MFFKSQFIATFRSNPCRGGYQPHANYRHDNSVEFIENICKIETFRAANSRPYSESFSMEQHDKREFEEIEYKTGDCPCLGDWRNKIDR